MYIHYFIHLYNIGKVQIHLPTKSFAGHAKKIIFLLKLPANCQCSIIPTQAPFPKLNTKVVRNMEKFSILEHWWQKYFYLFSLPGYNVQLLHWNFLVLLHRQNCGSHHTSFGLHLTRQQGHLTYRDSHHILYLRRNRS